MNICMNKWYDMMMISIWWYEWMNWMNVWLNAWMNEWLNEWMWWYYMNIIIWNDDVSGVWCIK